MYSRIIIALILTAISVSLTAFEFAQDGVSGVAIVVPEVPTAAERFTAEELQFYLNRITGAAFPIVATDRPTGAAIVIGQHPTNSALAASLDQASNSYERFAIQITPERVTLTAPHSVGLLYAGWELLEQLGVAWLMPGKMGTYIPSSPTLVLADFTRCYAPEVEFRSSTDYTNAGEEWKLKSKGAELLVREREHGFPAATIFAWRMRLNSNVAFDPADAYMILGAGHSYAQFLPIERYQDTHPEWFSLRDGKRRKHGELWQICITNPEAAAEFSKNAAQAIANARSLDIPEERILLFVSPNDYEEHCQCEKCAALTDSNGSASSRILYFANQVANIIHQQYPNVKVTYYIYHDYAKIPEKVTPAPGVYAFITAWSAANSIAANQAKPLMDPVANSVFAKDAAWFANNSAGIYVYPYYAHYEIFTPFPMMTQMSYDLKALSQYPNFIGMNSESALHWGSQPLNLYVYPKLIWDPQQDVNQLIDEFCRKAYGPAAAAVNEVFRIQQDQMDKLPYICGTVIESKDILTPEVIAACTPWIEQVTAALPQMDEATQWRTRLFLDGWKYSCLFAEAMHLLTTGTSPDSQKQIKDNLEAVLAYADTEIGRYAFANSSLVAGVNKFLPSVQLNLIELPVGKSTWREDLYYGGTLKFYTENHNTVPGLWGYGLEAHTAGELIWKLGSKVGKLESVRVSFGIAYPDLKLGVVENGETRWIAERHKNGDTGWIDIPKEFLNTDRLTLRIAGNNTEDASHIWLCVAALEVEVY